MRKSHSLLWLLPIAGGLPGALHAESPSFAPGVDIARGSVSGVSAMDAQDLSGDGRMDVVVLEGGKHAGGRKTFAWFQAPSSRDGQWTRHELSRPQPWRPFIGAAVLGDIDGDGDYDLVVSMDNHSGATRSAYLYWLENPRPTHAASAAWPVHTIAGDLDVHHINDMSLQDMDGNGRLDVVVRALEPNQLMFFFNDAAPGWGRRTLDTRDIASTGEGFAIGDLDLDGRLDISINGFWLEAPADVRTGQFVRHAIDTRIVEVNANTKEAIGDINQDGYPDVLISPAGGYRNGGNHVLAWYEGAPNPESVSQWPRHVLRSNTNGGHTVALADLEGDSDLDVVHGIAWNLWEQDQSISIFENLGAGDFAPLRTVSANRGLYSGVVRDVDGDGAMDLVGQETYASTSRPYVYWSNSAARFVPKPPQLLQ